MLAEPAPDALLLRDNISLSGLHPPALLVLLSYLYCYFAGPGAMFDLAAAHGASRER